MYCDLCLRNETVYIPTMGKMDKGFYRETEPVAVVPVSNTETARQALTSAIARGNPEVPMLQRGEWPPPAVLKYAGAKTWSAFERGMQSRDIEDKAGVFRISGNVKSPNGMWVADPVQAITFSSGTALDDVIDRMIAILQDAARK